MACRHVTCKSMPFIKTELCLLKRVAAATRVQMHIGPVGPNAKKEAVGVGMIARTAVIPQMIKLANDRARRLFGMGRRTMHLIEVAGQFPLRVVSIYDWAGADHDPQARANSQELMTVVFEELASVFALPYLLLGVSITAF